ncbi:MAG: hypothetical protein DRR06_17410 [Gammaproteobacteria bacterium]|nr:MAG: hypothetical protein DRR06_17410 [Gammaproteobacteria bacterium]
MYDNVKFSDLFDNERQAVVCYLSLERRYIKLCKDIRDEHISDQNAIALDEKNRSKNLQDYINERKAKVKK